MLALFAAGVVLVVAHSTQAKWGDRYVVAANALRCRVDASFDAPVKTTLQRDRALVEVGRQGHWLKVEISGPQGLVLCGWVYGRYVAPVGGAQPPPFGPVPQADLRTGTEPLDHEMTALQAFLDEYRPLARSYRKRNGHDLFRGVFEREDRLLRLRATRHWKSASNADQQVDLFTILQMWKRANRNYPVTVVVVDSQGTVLMTAYE